MPDNTDDFTVIIENISKAFGSVQALCGASLKIPRGTVTAIVGDNGSGKSTLVKILSGNLRPDSGTIIADGKSYPFLTVKQSLALGIRTVYQDLSLDNSKNCAENIFLGAELTKGPFLDKKTMLRLSRQLLDSINVQIADLSVPAGNLSGGQRQGLSIARALLQPGKLLILDEPTAAMGIQETHSAMAILHSLKKQGMTQLIISHNLFQVFDIADRIFVMRSGRCIADISTANTSPEAVQDMILAKEQKAEK